MPVVVISLMIFQEFVGHPKPKRGKNGRLALPIHHFIFILGCQHHFQLLRFQLVDILGQRFAFRLSLFPGLQQPTVRQKDFALFNHLLGPARHNGWSSVVAAGHQIFHGRLQQSFGRDRLTTSLVALSDNGQDARKAFGFHVFHFIILIQFIISHHDMFRCLESLAGIFRCLDDIGATRCSSHFQRPPRQVGIQSCHQGVNQNEATLPLFGWIVSVSDPSLGRSQRGQARTPSSHGMIQGCMDIVDAAHELGVNNLGAAKVEMGHGDHSRWQLGFVSFQILEGHAGGISHAKRIVEIQRQEQFGERFSVARRGKVEGQLCHLWIVENGRTNLERIFGLVLQPIDFGAGQGNVGIQSQLLFGLVMMMGDVGRELVQRLQGLGKVPLPLIQFRQQGEQCLMFLSTFLHALKDFNGSL
mmetsp:Transcript_11729/g.32483  ORF Transcript_11729/g.32483 Transcript_11729/m.32483 type:complete len:415 (+) Transcript_11729:1465-2709(+)